MNANRTLAIFAVALSVAATASAAVPGAINYQGRLTNASGMPQPGAKAMSLKIHDTATAGTLLYSEDLGTVTVDANGVYAFQFGTAGQSESLIAETLATTDGTTTSYQKTLAHTSLPGTLAIADGAFSWNEITGNPGAPAAATATVMAGFVIGGSVTAGGSGYTDPPLVTISGNGTGATATATVSGGSVTSINIISAGSGYTTGATITIAPPPTPFTVNFSNNTVTATYSPAPPSGRVITATYRYSASGISNALAAGAEQWLELTVDGVVQTPRQKILAVPFAMRAGTAEVAQRLEPKVNTTVLQCWTPMKSSDEINQGNLLVTLPTSVPIAGYSNPNRSRSLFKIFDRTVSTVHSISADATISGNPQWSNPPSATINLVAYHKSGSRTVVSSSTKNTSGSVVLTGPLELNHSENEYVLECLLDSGRDNFNSSILGSVTISSVRMISEN